jgi:hypothetical protein
MEMPIGFALGHVNAYNLGDGLDANYERYYRLLNCGFRCPASSGTDWWIYDHNRVFVKVENGFSYDSWLTGLRAGRTFVSNGPLLELSLNSKGPGESIESTGSLLITARAVSRIPFERLEIIKDGAIVAEQHAISQREARIEREILTDSSGWVAARVSGDSKTHAGYKVFAHTSPIYYTVPGTPSRRASAAGAFVDEIEESMRFIRKFYRFSNEADKALALGRFREGRDFYARLVAKG